MQIEVIYFRTAIKYIGLKVKFSQKKKYFNSSVLTIAGLDISGCPLPWTSELWLQDN